MGTGTSMEIAAITETVKGNPRLWGHLRDIRENHKKEQLNLPVEAVDVEDLCDPHQSSDIVEPIIYEEEEPEVDLNSSFSVTRHLMSQGSQNIRIVVVR